MQTTFSEHRSGAEDYDPTQHLPLAPLKAPHSEWLCVKSLVRLQVLCYLVGSSSELCRRCSAELVQDSGVNSKCFISNNVYLFCQHLVFYSVLNPPL